MERPAAGELTQRWNLPVVLTEPRLFFYQSATRLSSNAHHLKNAIGFLSDILIVSGASGDNTRTPAYPPRVDFLIVLAKPICEPTSHSHVLIATWVRGCPVAMAR